MTNKKKIPVKSGERTSNLLKSEALKVLNENDNIDDKGRFVKGNKASKCDIFKNIDTEITGEERNEVKTILQANSPKAVKLIVKQMNSTNTPLKTKMDLAQQILVMLYGKTPMEDESDNTVNFILSDEAEKYAK